MAARNTIKGSIKTKGIPESICFKNFADLLQNLGNYLTIEIPIDDITNVIISNQQPSDVDRDKLWVRRTNSGKIAGALVFSGGQWVQLFPAPQQVFILLGNSTTPPDGYVYMPQSLSGLSSLQYSALYGSMVLNNANGIYPAIFVGV